MFKMILAFIIFAILWHLGIIQVLIAITAIMLLGVAGMFASGLMLGLLL